MFKRRIRLLFTKTKKYKGSHIEICKQIIEDCWNGTYLQLSAGHFSEFYTRDFSWCCESLIRLGYKDKVKKTLEYALNIFSKQNKITTTISPGNIAFDFPCYASDSLPLLIRSLRILNDKNLIQKYKNFLNKEIEKYYNIVIDKNTGLVKKEKFFSSIKDHSQRKSSCYDNCMAAMLSIELEKIKILQNPFKKYNYNQLIKENFWKKTHFIDDLSGYDLITGDSNIFPFWCEIFNNKQMLKSTIKTIQEKNLDKPYPLRYYYQKKINQKIIYVDFFAKNYERDSVWPQMGLIYISLVSKVDRKKAEYYMNQYKALIEKHKNFLEIFDSKGNVFKSPFYYADESMLWCCGYIDLINKNKK